MTIRDELHDAYRDTLPEASAQQMDRWLETAASGFRSPERRDQARAELRSHMAELYEAYADEVPAEEAAARVLDRMGDAEQVARRYASAERQPDRTEWKTYARLAAVLLVLGMAAAAVAVWLLGSAAVQYDQTAATNGKTLGGAAALALLLLAAGAAFAVSAVKAYRQAYPKE